VGHPQPEVRRQAIGGPLTRVSLGPSRSLAVHRIPRSGRSETPIGRIRKLTVCTLVAVPLELRDVVGVARKGGCPAVAGREGYRIPESRLHRWARFVLQGRRAWRRLKLEVVAVEDQATADQPGRLVASLSPPVRWGNAVRSLFRRSQRDQRDTVACHWSAYVAGRWWAPAHPHADESE
jgi:hypothetical protein